MRDVQINLSPDIMKSRDLLYAIGYLATWGLGSERYHQVRIFANNSDEVNAYYYNKHQEVTYSMGAIRCEDGTYSFHS